jgi:hypothetical protein
MKKLNLILIMTGIFIILTPLFSQQENLGKTAKVNLQVINTEKAQKDIIRYLEKSGGFFTNRSNEYMQVKVPPEKLRDFLNYLKDLGMVVSESLNTVNYTDRINNLQVTIRTQNESLRNIMRILQSAGLRDTLDIERKVLQMIVELEKAKGNLNYIREHIRYAYVDIYFKTYASVQKRENARSPFGWINRLKLENVLGRY